MHPIAIALILFTLFLDAFHLPYLCHVDRFPFLPHDTINQMTMQNWMYQEYLAECLYLHPGNKWLMGEMKESEQLRKAWLALQHAQNDCRPESSQVRKN